MSNAYERFSKLTDGHNIRVEIFLSDLSMLLDYSSLPADHLESITRETEQQIKEKLNERSKTT